MSATESHNTFTRNLKLIDSTAIVMGSMIGSGIFIVSADIARQVGSPGWLMVVWILSGIMTIFAALSYGELAGMFPQAGGQYVYLREAFNPFTAFLYGWTLFLVIQTGTIAAVAMAFGKFIGVFLPWFSEKHILFHIGKIQINTVHIPAILSLLVLTLINLQGVRTGKLIQNIFTFTKVAALGFLLVMGLFFTKNIHAVQLNSQYFWDATAIGNGGLIHLGGLALMGALGSAMVGSLFSADAWNNITFTAGEVVNPKRNIPLSLFLGTFIVMVFYILANVAYLQILPLRGSAAGATVFERGMQFATSDRIGTAAMSQIVGGTAPLIMAMFIIISTFGCNNGLVLAGARVYYAMAKDKLFFRQAGKLNNKNVPGFALIVQFIWSSLLCLSGTYSDLLDYVVFSVLIFYVLTIAGIFVLRKKKADAERPYKAFGYPVIPAIYIILAVTIMGILLINKPQASWAGVIIIALGIPVYFITNRKKHTKA